MPRFLISERPSTLLGILADALDAIGTGILLLTSDMRVRFLNRRQAQLFGLPKALLEQGPTFRDLLEYAASQSWFAVEDDDLAEYINDREAAVRAGSIAATQISLRDGRRLLFSCITCDDGNRILTYTDISDELRREATEAVAQVSAAFRFSNETIESQAAHLASLAEAAHEHAQMAEAARRQLEQEIEERCRLEADLRRMATTDGLTGTLNRTAFMIAGQRATERARDPGRCLAMLMLDVDHFKMVNDRHGHAGGDAALQHLAATLRAGIRQTDLLGRLGGEEFGIILQDVTPELAEQIAERLRLMVAENPQRHADRLILMTVSIGMALAYESDVSVEQIMARADQALYHAKGTGRNRVVKHHAAIAA